MRPEENKNLVINKKVFLMVWSEYILGKDAPEIHCFRGISLKYCEFAN